MRRVSLALLLFTAAEAMVAPTVGKTEFASSLRTDADRAVAERGAIERSLLQPGTPMGALKQKRAVVVSGGFGGASKPAAKKGKAAAKKGKAKASKGTIGKPQSVLATELARAGVVRINNVLSKETAETLRQFVDSERVSANEDVDAGKYDRASRFADLVLCAKAFDHHPCYPPPPSSNPLSSMPRLFRRPPTPRSNTHVSSRSCSQP